MRGPYRASSRPPIGVAARVMYGPFGLSFAAQQASTSMPHNLAVSVVIFIFISVDNFKLVKFLNVFAYLSLYFSFNEIRKYIKL